jgi:hypothetical protein
LVTTPLVFANVFYILRKVLGIEKAKELLRKLRIMVGVVSLNVNADLNLPVFADEKLPVSRPY